MDLTLLSLSIKIFNLEFEFSLSLKHTHTNTHTHTHKHIKQDQSPVQQNTPPLVTPVILSVPRVLLTVITGHIQQTGTVTGNCPPCHWIIGLTIFAFCLGD